jgi:hypothetical protein
MAGSLGLDIGRALRDSYSIMARKYMKTKNTKKLAPVSPVSPPPTTPA